MILDTVEILLLLLTLQAIDVQLCALIESLDSVLVQHIREQRRLNRSLPIEKKRVTWAHFLTVISDTHFRQMFRMSEPVFTKLCGLICEQVTEDQFRPEAYLLKKKGNDEEELKLIAGEVKIAVSIRLLAGGSYLDLVPLFGVSSSHLYNVFEQFLQWIISTLEFPLVAWLRQGNWTAIQALADAFAEKGMVYFMGPLVL